MRTLVFSDTHLNWKFEEKKARFLRSIIVGADRIVIAGDFWDGWQINFSQFLDSPWKHLFPELKKKNTIYIYGNHDNEKLVDKRVSIFSSIQTHKFTLRLQGKNVTIEHGHRLCSGIDGRLRLSRPFKGARYILNHWDKLEEKLVRKFGKRYLSFFYGKYNQKIKKEMKKYYSNFTFLICGHTHLAEVDTKNRFYNTGQIRYGLGQYIIVENSKISPKEVWYEK